jgi:cytochrome P450
LFANIEVPPGILLFEDPPLHDLHRRLLSRVFYGRVVPEGSFMLLLNASANRDERRFADPDRFDIHREGGHVSFGQGLHFCLGSALARLEARVALEEVLKRWPEWEVDYANAQRAHTASVRGWARLPVLTGAASRSRRDGEQLFD